MSKYKYSFEDSRINSCDDCPCASVNQYLGYPCCMINQNIECSDITRPDDCPLIEKVVE